MELKIGYSNYKVTQEADLRGAGNVKCNGTIDEATQTLKLRLSNTILTNVAVLVHEIIHGVDYLVGLNMQEEEVLKLGSLLATIVVDNSHLMDVVMFDTDRLSSVAEPCEKFAEKVKVGWNVYKIRYTSPIYDHSNNNNCYNQVEYEKDTIEILDYITRGQKVSAIIYSLLGILNDEFGYDTDKEMRRRLSNGLATVIVDNPEVFRINWRDSNEEN